MQNYLLLTLIILVSGLVLYSVFRKRQGGKIEPVAGELPEKEPEQEQPQEEVPDQELPWDIEVIERHQAVAANEGEDLILTDDLKSYVAYMIDSSRAAGKVITKESKVSIQFKKDVLRQINAGELKLMKQKGSADQFWAIAVDKNNIIRHHGWTESKNVVKINPVQLANVVLGVMTVITSQEHLDKINQQLTTIDRKMDTLLRHYQNDKFGKIQGTTRYLKSILPSLLNEDPQSAAYLVKVEDFSSRSYEELESILYEFPSLLQSAERIREKAAFGIDKVVTEIKDLTVSFENILLLGYGNLEVLSVCLKIMTDLGNSPVVNENRLQDIETYFGRLVEFQKKYESILQDKNSAVKATFRRNKTVEMKKQQIEQQLLLHYEVINSNKTLLNEQISQFKEVEPSVPELATLYVEFDEFENITAVKKSS